MSRIPLRRPFPNPLGDSSRSYRASSGDFVIPLMFILAAGAVIITFAVPTPKESREVPESPGNRQVILDVPETSRVDAQVTSGNNTVNLQNL